MKKSFFLFYLLLLSMGCKNDLELAMERGIQFYEWDRIEEAILEFKFVIHNLSSKSKINYGEIRLLSRAHHNLAVSYARKNWYTDAIDEAQKAFEFFPTDDNRNVLELIKTKKAQKMVQKAAKSDSTSL